MYISSLTSALKLMSKFGREIKESTPFDVVIQKVIGAFDQINHKLSIKSNQNVGLFNLSSLISILLKFYLI